MAKLVCTTSSLVAYYFAHHTIEGSQVIDPTTKQRFTVNAPMMAEVPWQYTEGVEVRKSADSTLSYQKL